MPCLRASPRTACLKNHASSAALSASGTWTRLISNWPSPTSEIAGLGRNVHLFAGVVEVVEEDVESVERAERQDVGPHPALARARAFRLAQLGPGIVDEIELHLGGDHRRVAERLEPFDHAREGVARVTVERLAILGVHPERQKRGRDREPRHRHVATLGRTQDAVRVADLEDQRAVLHVLAPDVEVEDREREARPLGLDLSGEAGRDTLAARLAVQVHRAAADVLHFWMLIEPVQRITCGRNLRRGRREAGRCRFRRRFTTPIRPMIDSVSRNEESGEDRVGHERVERLVREVACVVERVALLLRRREAGHEDQRGGVEQEDRLVRVGGPGEPQHRRPDDPPEPRQAGQTVGLGRLDVAARDRPERAVEDLGRIGSGVQEQHHGRTEPGRGEGVEDRVARLERQEEEVGEEELDEERRAPEDEDEPLRRLADPRAGRGLAHRHRGGKEEPGQQGDRAEVDVPDHPRADKRDLLTECEVRPRQQPLAVAEAAEGVLPDRVPAAHGRARRIASPPDVACPWVSRTISRSSTTSEIRVKPR